MAGECSVEGCPKIARARGWCPMHYQRQRLTGDVGPAGMTRESQKGRTCSVAGCDQPCRKQGWCAAHHAQQYKTGTAVPFKYKWAERQPCKVCGSESGTARRRDLCSERCQQLWHRHGGVPANPGCARCGSEIDLATAGKNGRRKRSDTRLCRQCKSMHDKHWMSPGELANRDGLDCGICGEPVDLTLMAPELFRASVDHVTPRALGGTDDPANLQLAHLWCNQVKHHRLPSEFTLKVG